jgi:hypothetical protein
MVWLRREKDQENRLRKRKIDSSRYGVLDAELLDIKPRRLRIRYNYYHDFTHDNDNDDDDVYDVVIIIIIIEIINITITIVHGYCVY